MDGCHFHVLFWGRIDVLALKLDTQSQRSRRIVNCATLPHTRTGVPGSQGIPLTNVAHKTGCCERYPMLGQQKPVEACSSCAIDAIIIKFIHLTCPKAPSASQCFTYFTVEQFAHSRPLSSRHPRICGFLTAFCFSWCPWWYTFPLVTDQHEPICVHTPNQ